MIWALEAIIGDVLTDHTVAVVTYCVTKITTRCSPIIGLALFLDSMIVASIEKEWLV